MINNYSITNIYEKPSYNSKLSSQMIYGEAFNVLNIKNNWIKIKTIDDNYIGFIKKKKFCQKFIPKFKVSVPKAKIFIKKKQKIVPSKNYLYFNSRISFMNEQFNLIEFEKNKWIEKKNIKKINYIEKKILKIFKLFLNTKYLWGGKSCEGIDCSALIQIYFLFNNKFFPRDTRDQLPYLKKNKRKLKIFKDRIIFWKGHVAFKLNENKLIHAYGPKKKVLIMNIKQTYKKIKKDTNLDPIFL